MITENVIYKNNLSRWNFFGQSYLGGAVYTEDKDNLFKHRLEGDIDYVNRQKRGYFLNFCGPIVDVYANHLFRPEIRRKIAKNNPNWEKYKGNVDRRGLNIDSFMKEVSKFVLIHGKCFVLVDMPKQNNEIQTRADEIQSGMMPYFSIYTRPNVVDWNYDPDGRLRWIKFKEVFDSNPDWRDGSSSTPESYVYRTFTRTGWFLEKDTGESLELIESGTHDLGVVPVVEIGDGRSLLQDIAIINREIFNVCSLLSEIIYRQTFSQMVIQGDKSTADGTTVLTIGTAQAIYYGEGMEAPSFITPPGEPIDKLHQNIEFLINEIYRLAHVNAIPTEKREFYGSAQGKAWTFDDLNNALANKGEELETGEHQIWDLWFLWQDEDNAVADEYAKDYAVGSLSQDIENIIQGIIAKLPPLAMSKLRLKASSKLLSDLSEEENKLIETQCAEQMKRDEAMLDMASNSPLPAPMENGNQPRNTKGNYIDPNQ